MIKYDLVIFDCDGTLYDTFPGISENMKNTLRIMNLQAMPADFDWSVCVGPPLEYGFGDILGVPQNRIPEACKIYRENYIPVVIPLTVLFPKVEECLFRLSNNGVKLAVASSKSKANLAQTMEKDPCCRLFADVIGPTPENNISKTDAIIAAAERSGFSEDRILMVGDTHFDAIGAMEAGFDFARACWGYGKKEDFIPYKCVFEAADADELSGFILENK